MTSLIVAFATINIVKLIVALIVASVVGLAVESAAGVVFATQAN